MRGDHRAPGRVLGPLPARDRHEAGEDAAHHGHASDHGRHTFQANLDSSRQIGRGSRSEPIDVSLDDLKPEVERCDS